MSMPMCGCARVMHDLTRVVCLSVLSVVECRYLEQEAGREKKSLLNTQ
jgi:hypothetical protein